MVKIEFLETDFKPLLDKGIKRLRLLADGPHIVNKRSKFIVVTYWWGRGRVNRNFEVPCPEVQEWENVPMKKKGIKFEEMIKLWNGYCKKANVNHYSVEIPQFTKISVQDAINFKADFFKYTLERFKSKGFGVLYIDGDIKIHKYPAIFDLQNIDLMGQGWQSDGRQFGEDESANDSCWNPWLFELSGGVIFFGNTIVARKIVNKWIKDSNKKSNEGSADDRILSYFLNMDSGLAWANIFQLPETFLWKNTENSKDVYKRFNMSLKDITISHPACLTGEDRAAQMGGKLRKTGGELLRIPKNYTRYIWDELDCDIKNLFGKREFLNYEYIYLRNKAQAISLRNSNRFLSKQDLMKLIPYEKKYGNITKKIELTKKLIKKTKFPKLSIDSSLNSTRFNIIVYNEASGLSEIYEIDSNVSPVMSILKLFSKKSIDTVILIPPRSDKKQLKALMRKIANYPNNMIEFAVKNVNESYRRYRQDYILKIERDSPMYFSYRYKNSNLYNLLLFWATFEKTNGNYGDLQTIFNTNPYYLFLMRCDFF